MDAVKSIFEQMRRSRELAMMNESEETPVEETPVEETPVEETPEVINESAETEVTTEAIDEAEEFVVIKCHDCGAILSGLDEAEEGCPVCGSEDLDEKTVRVVKDGKVTSKKIASKKRKLTPAQKAALAKARKKAHTGAAQKQRAKSMKVRKSKGMNEGDTELVCPECGYEGEVDEFVDGGHSKYTCPECGASVNEKCEDDQDTEE